MLNSISINISWYFVGVTPPKSHLVQIAFDENELPIASVKLNKKKIISQISRSTLLYKKWKEGVQDYHFTHYHTVNRHTSMPVGGWRPSVL